MNPLWEQVAAVVTVELQPQPLPTRREGIKQHWQRWGRLQRIAAIVIPFVLLITIVGGTTLAVNNGFWGIFVHDQGAGNAYLKKLGKTVQLTQAHHGYTMTINWVYGDSIRTLVGYTIAGPSGHHFAAFDFTNADVTMQTDTGQQLPSLNGSSSDLSHGVVQQIASFDTSALSVTGTTLALHLGISQITARDDVNNAPTLTPIVVAGPFHFDYTTPYYAGQTISRPQTLSDHGKSVTLERVVITPSAARAYLKLNFPITDEEKFFGTITTPDDAGKLGNYGGVSLHQDYDPATSTVIVTSVQVSSQSRGQWSLEAHLFQLDQTSNSGSGKPSNDGTLLDLAFSFVVN